MIWDSGENTIGSSGDAEVNFFFFLVLGHLVDKVSCWYGFLGANAGISECLVPDIPLAWRQIPAIHKVSSIGLRS